MYNQVLIGQQTNNSALYPHKTNAVGTSATPSVSANNNKKNNPTKRKMIQMAANGAGIRKQPYLTPNSNNISNNSIPSQQTNLMNGILPYSQQASHILK